MSGFPILLMSLLSLLAAFGLLLTGCTTDSAVTSPEASPDRYALAASYSAAHAGDALLVWERGALVVETGQNGFDLADPHMLASGTKTFAGVAALAAIADGTLSPDARLAETLTAWQDDPQKSQVTLRQLLHLTSGLSTEVGQAPSFREALKAPLVDAPGTAFRYGPTAFQVFGALLRETLGGEDPLAYYQCRVFDPLGITASGWGRVDGSDPQLAGGARMTAHDWLRFGRMLLNGGTWNGQTILPPEPMDMLTTPTEASPGYGWGVWLNATVDPEAPFFDHTPPSLQPDGPNGMIYNDGPSDLYMAAGLFNQRLYVIPSREMVVVRFGRADAGWNDAEFLARLLNGTEYDAPAAPSASLDERVARATRLYMQRLDETLSLTEAQEAAIRPLVTQRLRVLLTFREETEDAGRWKRLREGRRLRDELESIDRAIKAELSDEQVDAYRALQEAQRERMRAQRQ